ncbi:aryl-sulfate sulfotransferase [Heyndrickxia oleronia]|uniref:aryl-sulfate sulfotransferase n=1 Tax=Heyndrickxia oleronia TaxID=38875 RepID=UPI003752FEFF
MKKFIIILPLLLIIGGMVIVLKNMKSESSSVIPKTTVSSAYDVERLATQEKTSSDMMKTYKKGNYSLTDPYIIKDPYNVAPLTALVMFKTKEKTKITITVEGKDTESTITKTISDFKTEHEIPIIGLYADYNNTVKIKSEAEDGTVKTKELRIETESLPEDFLQNEVVKANKEKMEDGLTFIESSFGYGYAVDNNGDVRWFSSLPIHATFKRLKNGNVLYVTKKDKQYNEILEMDMLGKLSNAYTIQPQTYTNSDVIHHDLIEMPNGNLLATVNSDEKYIEDVIVEIDRQTGEVAHTIDLKDILPENFYMEYDGPSGEDGEVDWFHLNAIVYDESDDSLIISGRHQDTVMKIDYSTSKIKWILADHEDWPNSYKKFLLTENGKDFKYNAGQHAPMILPDQDNNSDTLDILLFDNNNVISRGNKTESQKYSRAVQYRINEKTRTVKEVWSYGESRGKDFFSSIVGNAVYQNSTGNRLITSGYILGENDSAESRVVEVTNDSNANVVFELKITGFEQGSHRQVYRAWRGSLYPDLWEFKLDY